MKKLFCLVLVAICMLTTAAFAEKSYNSSKIYSGDLSTDNIVFKAGDKITGGKNISVELYYVDANNKVIADGNGTVKSVVIDGEKVTEWKMTERSGSVIQVGNMIYQAAYGFTLKPTYAVADNEGYYSILEKTYDLYSKNALKKKVKFAAPVIDQENGLVYVSIGENKVIAIETDEAFNINDKLNCKGAISEYVDYRNNSIPKVSCDEISIMKYEPLKKGDTGAEVLEMKKRMQALGYFKAGAELSDAYNDTCVERVKMFQKNNSLPATGDADAETLTCLYSNSAIANK